jgi:predicted AAA+ superfamily ATPase
MIKRQLYQTVLQHLGQFPAVALLGPRQVGKTTLANQIAEKFPSIYLDLELPSDLAKMADPELYLSEHAHQLVIIDEIQRQPQLFPVLRSLIDQGRRKGQTARRFLLLGSASLGLLQQSGESLAGRIAYLELPPFNVRETGNDSLNKLWLRGGFPDSYLATSETKSVIWRTNFIKTYLERDIPMLGPRIAAETLRRFWTMLAHHQGGMINAAELARSLAVDGKTIARYTDLLVDLMLVRRLMPWHFNTNKRLVKSPKIYVRDSGLTHTLLGINDGEQLLSHPVVGASWESFIIENIHAALSGNANLYFYRTAAGAEIDLLIEFASGKRWAIEIKRSSAPTVSKGFYHAIEDINPDACFIVCASKENYSLTSGIKVISLEGILSALKLETD